MAQDNKLTVMRAPAQPEEKMQQAAAAAGAYQAHPLAAASPRPGSQTCSAFFFKPLRAAQQPRAGARLLRRTSIRQAGQPTAGLPLVSRGPQPPRGPHSLVVEGVLLPEVLQVLFLLLAQAQSRRRRRPPAAAALPHAARPPLRPGRQAPPSRCRPRPLPRGVPKARAQEGSQEGFGEL